MSVFSSLTFPLRRSRVRPGRGSDRFHQTLNQFVIVVAQMNTIGISYTRSLADFYYTR